MGKPHKHAALIKAWADGAEIQFKFEHKDEWHTVHGTPSWDENGQYRIKPEQKPDVIKYVYAAVDFNIYIVKNTICDIENLKLTFDGETGKLKSAEVLS